MANSNPTASNRQFERLEILFDYTKFHIGMYTVLLTALLALMSLGSEQLPHEYHLPARITAFFFMLAGAFGGVVASNICKFSDIDKFRGGKIGPWGMRCFPGRVWASLEHLFFWLGILNAALSIGLGKSYFLASAPVPGAHLGLSTPWGP